MKKLLVLVVAAAVIGIVISRGRQPSLPAAQTGDDPGAVRPGAIAQVDASEVQAPQAAPVAVAPAEPAPAAPSPAEAEPQRLAQRPQEHPALTAPPLLSAMMRLPVRPAASPAPVPAPAPAAEGPSPTLDVLGRAQSLLKAGKRAEARDLLTPLYLQARGQRAAQLRRVLDAISAELVFNPRCTEGATVHVVAPGEVGVRIARRYGVNWGMIARINGMDKDAILHVGQKLKVLEGTPSIVVHRGEFRLTLLWNGAYVKEYSIGIGKAESPTPDGEFVVEDLVVRAPWTNPQGGIVKYGEPDYPLGERWMGFQDEPGANGLGIHGTNEEASIGTMCSNGCLRMHNADVLELYDFMTVGAHVTIEE